MAGDYGSLKIGRYCMIGGASVINGHMEICDKVTVTGMGMVMRPITEPGVYSSGIPLQPNKVCGHRRALAYPFCDGPAYAGRHDPAGDGSDG